MPFWGDINGQNIYDVDSVDAESDYGLECSSRGRYENDKLHKCKYCGANNLVWQENDEGKWRLHYQTNENEPHKCDKYDKQN